jgi:hypothetical protein
MDYELSDEKFDGPYQYDNPSYSEINVNYTEYNEVENSMYTNVFIWGWIMVGFTYCTIRVAHLCTRPGNNRDTDLNHRLVNNTPIKYTDINYTDCENIDTCSICLLGYKENEALIRLNCSHIYHKGCVFSWFKNNRNCPLCRMSV